MLFPRRVSPHRTQPLTPARPSRRLPWRTLVVVALIALLGGAAMGAARNPDLVAALVDDVRALAGPQVVAQIETIVFQAQDRMRQAQYHATGAAPKLHWATPAQSHATPHKQDVTVAPASAPARPAAPAVHQADVQASGTSTTDSAGPSWSPYVLGTDGNPLLERAIVAPDPNRPYVQAALVRIDLTRTRLRLVAGTAEPLSRVAVARPGTIPARDFTSGDVLAAFNGGFKAANGHYGMEFDGTVLLPPRDGLATLALYRDGRVRLGVWGQDITATPDLVALRQNCPLLLDNGMPTPETATPTAALWGNTVGNKVATWRSGLGLSADGRSLIYAVGDGLTVPALATALQQAGAGRAMQLDINSFWTRFVTFTSGPNKSVQAQKLLDEMAGGQQQFIAPDSRDFFYVTRR